MISGLMKTIGFFSSSPRVASIVTTRLVTPICTAAKPTPGASYIVSNISSISFLISASIFWTGVETLRKTGSGNCNIGRIMMSAK